MTNCTTRQVPNRNDKCFNTNLLSLTQTTQSSAFQMNAHYHCQEMARGDESGDPH